MSRVRYTPRGSVRLKDTRCQELADGFSGWGTLCLELVDEGHDLLQSLNKTDVLGGLRQTAAVLTLLLQQLRDGLLGILAMAHAAAAGASDVAIAGAGARWLRVDDTNRLPIHLPATESARP